MTSVLELLVRLFPRDFREQFGSDMAEQIERDHRQALARGLLATMWFFISTALDLIRSAAAERLNPTWAGARSTSNEGRRGLVMRMSDWRNDLSHALRSLRRQPGFTATAVGTLGLALGALTGVFGIVQTVLLDPLPYDDADRLVHIAASAPGSEFPPEFGVSAEFFVQYREQSELLEDVSTYNSFTATLRTEDRVERIRMSAPTHTFFGTLGATPMIGAIPTADEAEQSAVLSHALWTEWFGGDPSVIGRSYWIGDANRTIVAVMKPEFWFQRQDVLVWIPVVVRPEGLTTGRFGNSLVARTVPGTDLETLRTELNGLAARLPDRFGGSAAYANLIEQHRAVVRSLDEELLGSMRTPLFVLFGSIAIVLLIACANVANLFVVRGERRQGEFALRRAIGAGVAPLVRLQMAEVSVIAFLAGAVAVGVAWAGVPAFVTAAPRNVPRLADVGVTPATLGFAALAALAAALLCGLVPALRSARPNLARLREGGRSSTRRKLWGRDVLVAAQAALALVLLIGSGLLIQSFRALKNVDPGYDTAEVFSFQIAPEEDHLNDGPSFARFHMDFVDRLRALPGVESVGIIENLPLNEGIDNLRMRTEQTAADLEGGPLVGLTWAGADYFETMGIEVLRGRSFQPADHTSELGNAVVSQAAADLLWPGEDPIGRRLQHPSLDTWETVVGVVEDVMQYGFRGETDPLVYFPLAGQTPDSWALASPAYVLKTERGGEIAGEVRALVREVAPSAPMYRVFTMDELATDSMTRLSFTMLTLGTAALLALFLGSIGLYGVLSYVVAERTQEIGVRMALGAQARKVQQMVVARGVRVVALGVAVGALFALAATRVLSGLLFGVEAVDPGIFLGMSAAMIGVGLLASYLPARRASSVDPVRSLRME